MKIFYHIISVMLIIVSVCGCSVV